MLCLVSSEGCSGQSSEQVVYKSHWDERTGMSEEVAIFLAQAWRRVGCELLPVLARVTTLRGAVLCESSGKRRTGALTIF